MKVLLLLSAVALSAASLLPSRSEVSVGENGVVRIVGQSGREIDISPNLLDSRKVNVVLRSPVGPTRVLQIDEADNIQNVDSSFGQGSQVNQAALLANIFRQYQGSVNDIAYGQILGRIQSLVQSGIVNSRIWDVLRNLNEAVLENGVNSMAQMRSSLPWAQNIGNVQLLPQSRRLQLILQQIGQQRQLQQGLDQEFLSNGISQNIPLSQLWSGQQLNSIQSRAVQVSNIEQIQSWPIVGIQQRLQRIQALEQYIQVLRERVQQVLQISNWQQGVQQSPLVQQKLQLLEILLQKLEQLKQAEIIQQQQPLMSRIIYQQGVQQRMQQLESLEQIVEQLQQSNWEQVGQQWRNNGVSNQIVSPLWQQILAQRISQNQIIPQQWNWLQQQINQPLVY